MPDKLTDWTEVPKVVRKQRHHSPQKDGYNRPVNVCPIHADLYEMKQKASIKLHQCSKQLLKASAAADAVGGTAGSTPYGQCRKEAEISLLRKLTPGST